MGPSGALFTAEAGGALAAIMTALLVQTVSGGPLGLRHRLGD
jgi:hypothetical protein